MKDNSLLDSIISATEERLRHSARNNKVVLTPMDTVILADLFNTFKEGLLESEKLRLVTCVLRGNGIIVPVYKARIEGWVETFE
jgi:hypothetical protein